MSLSFGIVKPDTRFAFSPEVKNILPPTRYAFAIQNAVTFTTSGQVLIAPFPSDGLNFESGAYMGLLATATPTGTSPSITMTVQPNLNVNLTGNTTTAFFINSASTNDDYIKID